VAKYGAPLIVADFGTALTFDVVSPERAYIGGIIAPGLPLMTDYLYEKTALLPRVKAGGQVAGIGRSTREAIRSGAKIGYRGIVREITNELLKTLGRKTRLVATGGFARWVLADSNIPYLIDPTLTLFGLGRLFELNREKK